jgi:hypothetical protein
MALFNILVDIAARTADFESGMQRVEKRLDSFSAGAAKLASRAAGVLGLAIGFNGLKTAVEGAIQRGDELGRLSEALQVSVKDLSQLQYAARANDVDFKTLTGSIATFQKGLGQAANGTGRAQQAIKDLGLDAKALAALPLGQQLDVVADALKNIGNPTQRARIALQLFGDAGLDLLPILSQGADGIRRLREESDKLGFTLDDSGSKKLQEADAAVKLLTGSWQGLVNTLAVRVAPAIVATADAFRKLLGGATEIEKLQTKLDILKAEKDSSIPLFLNLGYVDGSSVVMGPTALKKAIDEIESRIASLKKAASEPQKGGGGAEAKPEAPIVRDWINPQLMLELSNNFDFLEERARETAKRLHEAAEETKDFWASVNKGVAEGVSDTSHDVEESLREFSERYAEIIGMGKAAHDEMSEYAKQAARNMQDAFADFLFDPFQDGLKGMLKSFIDVIRRMLAEAAAAQIFEKLFGKDGKSGAGGNILGAILGAFGGGKAKGGPLESGKWYVAGEHGPEPIWGGGGGAFAMGYGGSGGGSVTVNMPVDMRGASVDAVKLLIAEQPRMIRQAADLAKAELRNDKRRGRF